MSSKLNQTNEPSIETAKQKQQPFSTSTYRKITLIGYAGLLLLMPLWLFCLSPSALSPALTFVLFIVPLLLPLKGIMTGNPYTHAWANFIVLIYFMHSLTSLWVSPNEIIYAGTEFIFASMMFYGATYYAKYRGQELGLGIKKLKVEMAEEKARMENQTHK